MGNSLSNSSRSKGNHASKMPDKFHEITPDDVIKVYALAALKAINRKGTVDGVSQNIGQSPYDWYGAPKVTSDEGIKHWLKLSGLEVIEDWQALVKTLRYSILYTTEYMIKKGYYLPKKITQIPNFTKGELVSYFQGLSTFSQDKDIEAVSVFLKFLRATYQCFTFKKNNGDSVFNPITGELSYKDTEFIREVIAFFGTDIFKYKKPGNIKFSTESDSASGLLNTRTGLPVPFIAKFRPKTIDSQICKGVSQVSYDTMTALKDRNALRIEVRELEHIPHLILELLKSGLYTDLGKVSLEQKGQLFPKSSEIWGQFTNTFLSLETEELRSIFLKTPSEKIKPNTIPDREEVKIVSKDPSFEIQIMLIGNTNNAGWKADPFYKMKEDIDEEIRVNQGYIHKGRVLEHIERWQAKLSLYQVNGLSSKTIFERFLNIDKKLIPLYQTSSILTGTGPHHAEFFTNKDFIGRSVKIRHNTLPWSYWSFEANTWISLNSIKNGNALKSNS